ncbi:MAG: hypothetical protein HDKAJFGB_01842 [Anaerolineae bacterium]|nr:hypothetical protein [Anaerolineae bacterium]
MSKSFWRALFPQRMNERAFEKKRRTRKECGVSLYCALVNFLISLGMYSALKKR